MSMKRWLILPLLLLIAAAPTTQSTLDEQCRQTLEQWKERLQQERFVSLVAPPFVIVGNGGLKNLERYRDHTVLAAARALWATYFTTRPQKPILIFLFEDAETYKRLARKWFNDSDVPHFGFCRADGIMLMNISTGGGTLVHEVVHALISPDFPQVPSWFNEGLGSLYEQCSIEGDKITGLKNWRLPALQKAIADDSLQPLDELFADPHFYDEAHVGLNYAQARYLLMYLQEKDLLVRFYQRFRENVKSDPTGRKTLHDLIGPDRWDDFERSWRKWVAGL